MTDERTVGQTITRTWAAAPHKAITVEITYTEGDERPHIDVCGQGHCDVDHLTRIIGTLAEMRDLAAGLLAEAYPEAEAEEVSPGQTMASAEQDQINELGVRLGEASGSFRKVLGALGLDLDSMQRMYVAKEASEVRASAIAALVDEMNPQLRAAYAAELFGSTIEIDRHMPPGKPFTAFLS